MKANLTDLFKPYPRCLLILVFLSIWLTACAGARMEAPSEAEPFPPGRESDMVAAATSVAGAQAPTYADGAATPIDDVLANASAQAQGPRVIIYTGNISLVIQNTQEAVVAITSLAKEQGGYVAGSNIYQSNNVPRGTITIRVPAENYETTLAQLRALAVRVESENSNTQDVTEEFTDLQARKTNLEFTEEALQKLLEERQRVGSTSDILEVYRELTNVRGQIEQIEGRLRYLANQSALSTITIDLIPDVLYQPVSVAGWEPRGVAREALQALVAGLQGLANVLIWILIFVLPMLLILLIPLALFIWIVRRWWKRRARRTAPPQPPATAPGPS